MLKFYLNKNMFLNKSFEKKIKNICKIIYKSKKDTNNNFFEISIINEEQMQEICKKYYKNKISTDVLAFNNNFKISKNKIHIGEIFINNDKVISQSNEYNHSYLREVLFLITHGILHLIGYNHENFEDEKEMINFQNEILEKIKVGR